MARSLTAGVVTETTAAEVRPALLVEGVFSTGTLRLWSGVGTLSWNSQSWTGAGNLLSVSPIEETAAVQANGVTITFTGISSSNLSLALGSVRSGRAGKIWLAFLNSSDAVVADPVLIFSGRLDVCAVEEAGETSTISISYESRLIDLERPRERRYTDEDQQFEYSGDRGLEYVAGLQDKVIQWGR